MSATENQESLGEEALNSSNEIRTETEILNRSLDDEIAVVSPVKSDKKQEVITLSSDSDSDDTIPEQTAHASNRQGANASNSNGDLNEDEDLEIINELPFSYMNRPRGPKPDFLKRLLLDTNRELKLGRKITDNTYQMMQERSLKVPILVPKPVGHEITLSSDEEPDDVKPNSISAKQDSLPGATENVSCEDKLEMDPIPEEASVAATSTAQKKTTCQPSNKLSPKASVKKYSQTQSLQEQIEAKIKANIEERNKLGQQEVDLEQMDDDETYEKYQKLNQACTSSYAKLCRSKKMSSKVGRPIEKKIKFRENLTGYPEIEKAVAEFVNSGKMCRTPAFYQILRIVEKNVAGKEEFDRQKTEHIAKILLEEIAGIVRKRRDQDSLENGFCENIMSIFSGTADADADPADSSPELLAKLEKNASLWKNESDVMDEFKKIQERLEESNPTSADLQEDPDYSDSDDDKKSEPTINCNNKDSRSICEGEPPEKKKKS